MVHRSSIRIARDYNRGLPWWIRWCHIAWAATASPLIRGLGWCFAAERRFWAGSLLVAVVLLPIVIPRDAVIGAFLVDAFSGVGGDIRREIKAWQQFGGVTSVAVFA
ncbi:MAG TPA: hypothetical protein PKU91_06260, partial [Phycisphaerales bacterium]|nr:hypothetical protein [Phycisphaerales bacterium]